jgi:hypothetical protein
MEGTRAVSRFTVLVRASEWLKVEGPQGLKEGEALRWIIVTE